MVLAALVIVLLILVNALYVAAEFAAVSARRSRIRELARSGHWLARRFEPVVADAVSLDRYVATSQIGITLSSLVLGAYAQVAVAAPMATWIVARQWMDPLGAASLAATGVLLVTTMLQVLFGELMPKSAALRQPTAVGLATVLPMQWSIVALRWFIDVLNGSANVVLKAIGISQAEGHRHIHSPEEIELLIAESRDGGLLEPEEQRRLHKALRLGLRTARQLMVPRPDVVTVDRRTPGEVVLDRLMVSPFSRVPVHDGSIDDIVGVLHVRDVVADFVVHRSAERVMSLVRPLGAVPETLGADSLLRTFRDQRAEILMVVDEFGGFAGIVTVGDVVAELLGSIERDTGESLVETLADGRLRVPAHLSVIDLPDTLSCLWPRDDDTIAGLVLRVAGRLPAVGERLDIHGVEVEIERVADRVPERVVVRLPAQPPTERGDG
jgi:putative hemolysin